MIRRLGSFVALAALWCAPAAHSQAGDLRTLSRSLERVVTSVAPVVVQIRVTAYAPVEGNGSSTGALIGTERSTGSGVVVSADGYILTNAHVVRGGRRFIVVLPRPAATGVPGRSALAPVSQELGASLVGLDDETDLALLKVPLTGLASARFGDSDSLQSGQIVLAFGSPLGLARSVTMGVVSAVGRQLRDEDRMIYIQTDTPINPGNSGGPLVNVDGAVIGINTLIISQSGGNEGIGFAAPGNIARFVFEQLRANGRVRRGTIGVFGQTITPALAQGLGLSRDWGAILADVDPDGPAAKAGLRVGDLVNSVDGKPIENGRQLDVTLYRRRAGDSVTINASRDNSTVNLRIPVVERQDELDRFRGMVTPDKNLLPRLGILGLELTPELAQRIPGIRAPHGVVVAAVSSDAGGDGWLQPGDVIYGVNGAPTASLDDLRRILAQIPPGGAAVLQIGRQGQLRFATGNIE